MDPRLPPHHSDVEDLHKQLAKREAELSQLNQRLHHLIHWKNRLLNLVAQDIRTPITAIKLVAEVIEYQFQDQISPGLRRLLDIFDRNITRLEAHIDDLNLIANLDLDGISLTLGPVDLNAEVQRAITTFFPHALRRGIELDAVLGEVPPLEGDANHIRRMAMDLIGTSLARLERGQCMVVETLGKNDGAWIRVSDNGPPLSQEEVETILRQLKDHPEHQEIQISLYVAHQIAERHGGHLDIHSDGGVTFAVWLPRTAKMSKESS